MKKTLLAILKASKFVPVSWDSDKDEFHRVFENNVEVYVCISGGVVSASRYQRLLTVYFSSVEEFVTQFAKGLELKELS